MSLNIPDFNLLSKEHGAFFKNILFAFDCKIVKQIDSSKVDANLKAEPRVNFAIESQKKAFSFGA